MSHAVSNEARVAELEAALAKLGAKHKQLQLAYERTLEALRLLERRLFIAKAERAPSNPKQLAFDSLLVEAERLAKELAESGDAEKAPSGDSGGSGDSGEGEGKGKNGNEPKGPKNRPGRRNLGQSNLPTVSVEITNPELEGKVERIGWEKSFRLGFERGGQRCIVILRAVYKQDESWEQRAGTELGEREARNGDGSATANGACACSTVGSSQGVPMHVGETKGRCAEHTISPLNGAGCNQPTTTGIVKAAMPKEIVPGGMLAPSAIAHILVSKYLLGVPFYRLEQQWALEGVPLNRSTMCRYAEEVGAALGCIVEAMHKEALNTAFCLSTDATGICIQPEPMAKRKERKPMACRKGHFFVVLADCDHVFFEYQPKHTSAAVCSMFANFQGYIQADAHTIYDAVFRGDGLTPKLKDELMRPPVEVACWSHCRRNFWEAASCKYVVGVEGIRRIDLVFAAEGLLAKLPPATRKARREVVVRPLVDSFFAWVAEQSKIPRERGLVSKALGYAMNQEKALRRFLEDGRLQMTNNGSERALRPIAAARKVFMFFGSDDHASAAANLFSLIASCKLHRLDPQAYLEDVIRVLPYWPRNRHLELAPRYWARTRARLDPAEMALPLGHITVPPPPPPEQKSAST